MSDSAIADELRRLTLEVRRVADALAEEDLPTVSRNSYLTLSQLSELTGYHRNTLYSWVRRTDDPLPAKRAPGAQEIRVRWADFEDWMQDYQGDVKSEAESVITELARRAS